MDNYPLNYSGTNPPWDNPEADITEKVVEDAIQSARSLIANTLPDMLWEVAKEAVEENLPDGEWEEWAMDNKEQILDSVYDELFDDAKILWEHDI